MKYKAFNWMLLAAIICGLSITVSSCKDDNNDDNKSEAQKEQEAQVKSSKFWSVVGQLVSVDDVTDDYEGKTFEPTYGLPDGTNATTRIVNTNDMRTAAQRFANLVDATGIDENTPSYTWSDPAIGSMTYTRGGTPAEWATVDVDIKAVPRLQRIIYRAGGEGDNASVNGKAYYRFGDVVSRQVTIKNDQKKNNDTRGTITEYWICVRPSFGPEGKGDSHWVCVNTVSDKNYKYYKASTGADYWLPTSLKTDKENMQNFAELLWAICRPDDWFSNVFYHHTDGKLWGFSGVPFFTDFTYKHLNLHNANFWKNVQRGWKNAEVVQNALNLSSLEFLTGKLADNGVHLLYNGYSWWFSSSWDCELWEAVYTNGTKEEELNMHHAVYNDDLEKNMKGIKFDVRKMGKDTENYNDYFNDGKFRWAIRHATGKELADDKKYDPKKPISGVREEYRYYRDVVPTPDLSGEPESTDKAEDRGVDKNQAQVGYILATNGKFYKNQTDLDASDKTGAAIVVYKEYNVETGKDYNGLALALKPSTGTYSWGGGSKKCFENEAACYFNQQIDELNGLAITQRLGDGVCPDCGGTHPVFQATKNFNPTISGTEFSPWFVPSTGQWLLMLKSFGATVKFTTDEYKETQAQWGEPISIGRTWLLNITLTHENYQKMRQAFIDAGAEWGKGSYWTANFLDYEDHYDRAYFFLMSGDPWSNDTGRERDDLFQVSILNANRDHLELPLRPMIAF